MDACCEHVTAEQARRVGRLRRVLWWVLGLNLVLFASETLVGWLAESTALQGDALDGLADATLYGVTLGVVGAGLRAQAGAALLKGAIQAVFGLGVLATAVWRAWAGAEPLAPWMAGMAGLALAVNLACFGLLARYRNDGVNLRSVWLCSRNDVASNLGVIAAAGLVAWTGTRWPDLLVGGAIAALFMHTSAQILSEASRVRQAA
jgi:Co/Zn/Cd efflux system component